MTRLLFKSLISLLFFAIIWGHVNAQEIVDPCFASIPVPGKFQKSDDIRNICRCYNSFESSNLIEWNGAEWLGDISGTLTRVPPAGCSARGLWIGYRDWTQNGEAFALRLTTPLKAGQSYTFTFTYAKDGIPLDGAFSPIFYTALDPDELTDAIQVGRLPATVDWTTQSITFTANANQNGHTWIALHARETSGTILSDCVVENPIRNNFLEGDTTICQGDVAHLSAPENPYYTYEWSTGETSPSINVFNAGTYTLSINYYSCTTKDTIIVNTKDCEVRLIMPNYFSPNGDTWNQLFVPKEHNYIESGRITIYNRWGGELFKGDVFAGWNGSQTGNNSESAPDVYYYNVNYVDQNKNGHSVKGSFTLAR